MVWPARFKGQLVNNGARAFGRIRIGAVTPEGLQYAEFYLIRQPRSEGTELN